MLTNCHQKLAVSILILQIWTQMLTEEQQLAQDHIYTWITVGVKAGMPDSKDQHFL